MAKTKIAGNPEHDPTLPKIELELDGRKYSLCFTFGALAVASTKLRALGIESNLLHALNMGALDADAVAPLLFAALMTHSPNISYDTVASLITMRSIGTVLGGIMDAYEASIALPSGDAKSNPQEPE